MREGSSIKALNNTPDPAWVAVVGQLRKDHGRLPLPYARAVEASGGLPRVISTFHLLSDEAAPPDLDVVSGCDPGDASVLDGAVGLVLPGGGDIDPAWYGRSPHPRTTRISHRRDRFELTLLEAALERDLPVLAICHGMQLLNVHFGGTLDQHLRDAPQRGDHDCGLPAPEPVHGLRVKERSQLAEFLGTFRTGVNSHHHQGVEQIGDGLEEVAWADDGVLEAVTAPSFSFVVGVQWHPEAMAGTDPVQRRLFDSFVEATGSYTPRSVTRAARSRS